MTSALTPTCEPLALDPAHGLSVAQVQHAVADGAIERFMHFHDACEIVLFERVKGTMLAGGRSYPLSDGTLVFLPPLATHDFILEPADGAWVLAQCAPYLIEEACGDLAPLRDVGYVTLDPVGLARARTLFDWLLQAGPRDGQQTIVRSLLNLGIALFASAGPAETDHRPSSGVGRLRPALDQLHTHPGTPLSAQAAATLCGLSTAYFSRRFHAIMGQSFESYVAAYRLQVGAHLLLSTRTAISLIAYRAGFSNPSHFSARFRQRFGITPGHYRLLAHRNAAGQDGHAGDSISLKHGSFPV